MIISARWVTARKRHRCDGEDCGYMGCSGWIEPGDRYVRMYGYAHRPDPPYVLRKSQRCVVFYPHSPTGCPLTEAIERSGTTAEAP